MTLRLLRFAPLCALAVGLSFGCSDILGIEQATKRPAGTGGSDPGTGAGGSNGTGGTASVGGGGSGGIGEGGAPGGGGGTGGDGGSACADWMVDYTSRYHCEVHADQPRSYWRLGESAALTTMADEGSMNHTATRIGNVVPVQGAIASDTDMAASFEGGRVEVEMAYAFEGNLPYSVELWVKPNVHPSSSFYALVDRINSVPVEDRGWGLSIRASDNQLRWSRLVDGFDDNLSMGVPPEGEFSHVVATYDGTNLRGYVNGMSAGMTGATTPIEATSPPLSLGSASGAFGAFDGVLDEVAIYNYALMPDRIAQHYEAGIE